MAGGWGSAAPSPTQPCCPTKGVVLQPLLSTPPANFKQILYAEPVLVLGGPNVPSGWAKASAARREGSWPDLAVEGCRAVLPG